MTSLLAFIAVFISFQRYNKVYSNIVVKDTQVNINDTIVVMDALNVL